MNDVAVPIGQHLNFDVSGPRYELFEKDGSVAERRQSFALTSRKCRGHFGFAFDHPHAAPTAARGGLEHHGIADLACYRGSILSVWNRLRTARHNRNAERACK